MPWSPSPSPGLLGFRSGLGLTKHLPELCSQAHARHLLSPGREVEACSPSTCQSPGPHGGGQTSMLGGEQGY